MTPLIAMRIEILRPGPEADVIIKNDRTTVLTLVGLREPGRQSRVGYAPTPARDGEIPLSITWQQGILGFEVAARGAVSEAVAQAAIDELADALHPLSVTAKVFYEGGLTRTWSGHGGSVVPTVDRDYVNLRNHDPVWAAALPVHPIPS